MTGLALWLQLLVQAAATGAIYGLVAFGIVLAYKTSRIVNFAQGDLVMLAAFCAWYLIVPAGVPFGVASLLVVAGMAAVNAGMYTVALKPVASQSPHAATVTSIGLGFVIRGAISLVFGPDTRSYPTPWMENLRLGHLVVSDIHLMIWGTLLVITAAYTAVLRLSWSGLALQAVSDNPRAARLMGVSTTTVSTGVWALSGAVAGLGGLLLAPLTLVDSGLWQIVIKAFSAAIVGGLNSPYGALLGGLLIGIAEQFAGVYLPDGFREMVPAAVLLLTLSLKPKGLFGGQQMRDA